MYYIILWSIKYAFICIQSVWCWFSKTDKCHNIILNVIIYTQCENEGMNKRLTLIAHECRHPQASGKHLSMTCTPINTQNGLSKYCLQLYVHVRVITSELGRTSIQLRKTDSRIDYGYTLLRIRIIYR